MGELLAFSLILPAAFFVLSGPAVKKRNLKVLLPKTGRAFTHGISPGRKKIRVYCPHCRKISVAKRIELFDFSLAEKTRDQKTRFVELKRVQNPKSVYFCSCGAYLALKDK